MVAQRVLVLEFIFFTQSIPLIETVDGVELEVDSIQMKRLRNAGRNSGVFGEDTLLVDIH